MDGSKLDVTMTQAYVDALDRLVEEGLYLNRGEIILDALRRLLREQGIEPFSKRVKKSEKSSD